MANKKITDLQLRASVTGDLNFPSDDTIQSYRVTGSQIFDYVRSRIYPGQGELTNLGLAISMASNAMTIALKTKAGTDATTTDKVRVGFRSATLASGTFNLREVTSALSLVVSSGSTLGQVSTIASRQYVYLLDNGGVLELAVSRSLFTEDALYSTTAEGGAGAADSGSVLYSATARTSVPIRLIGYFENTQTNAGLWVTTPTKLQLMPKGPVDKDPYATILSSGSGTYYPGVGCLRLIVELVGGGGAGGGAAATASGQAAAGSGGGGGGYTRKVYVNPDASYAYAVGAGGTAGTAGNVPGNPGGNTTFGGLTGAGGGGGSGGANVASTQPIASGGGAGNGSGGDFSSSGANGLVSYGFSGNGVAAAAGGDSFLGKGGPGGVVGGAGTNGGTGGLGYGGGGGGSGNCGASQTAKQGAVGAVGVIIIREEYF